MRSRIRERLQGRYVGLLKEFDIDVAMGGSRSVLRLAALLPRFEALLAAYQKLDERAETLLAASRRSAWAEQRVESRDAPASGREHGAEIRAHFLRQARIRQLVLSPYRGAIFLAPDGSRVGVAVATERKPDRWLLALTEGAFDAAVLLCHDRSGQTLDVCLPRSFVKRFGARLSRSCGQTKFNVVRRGADVMLGIPFVGPHSVESYVGSIPGLLD